MLVLTVPALSLRLGNADASNDPHSQTTYKSYELLSHGFGQGFSGPLLIAIKLPNTHISQKQSRNSQPHSGPPLTSPQSDHHD
jgi:uncharacterized membrane protein YdfJ with MMPL/SSD domain